MRSFAPRLHAAYELAARTLRGWWNDDPLRLGAALAYYTVFSMAPVLILAIAVAGAVFGEEAARGAVVAQLRELVGPDGARVVQEAIEHASLERGEGWTATAIAAVMILIGASGAFAQLQRALDEMWDVEAPATGLRGLVRTRLVSFGLVLLIGFVLLVSLVISAGIAAIDEYGRRGPDWLQPVMTLFHLAASLGIETLLFASIFKVLPSVSLRWSDVWVGGFVTALLFEVGKVTIGLYLGNAGVASAYGAAGSLAVLLVWVYYSSQILFLGAEFTQAWTQREAASIAASETTWAGGWRGSDAQRS